MTGHACSNVVNYPPAPRGEPILQIHIKDEFVGSPREIGNHVGKSIARAKARALYVGGWAKVKWPSKLDERRQRLCGEGPDARRYMILAWLMRGDITHVESEQLLAEIPR